MSEQTPVRGSGRTVSDPAEATPAPASPRQGSAVTEGQGWAVLSYLVGGVLVWGLIGWLADYLLDTRFLLPVGIVIGAAGGVYLVIKRFGGVLPPPGAKR